MTLSRKELERLRDDPPSWFGMPHDQQTAIAAQCLAQMDEIARLRERDAVIACQDDEIEALRKQVADMDEALERIKKLVCGDAAPNWDASVQTAQTRMRIADLCDEASARAARGKE